MAARHICSSGLGAATCTGYLIRSYVAASRAEMRTCRPSLRPLLSSPSSINGASRVRFMVTDSDLASELPSIDQTERPSANEEAHVEEEAALESEEPTDATENVAAETTATEANTSPTNPDLPWYLQVSPPVPLPVASQRQSLPPLPPSPPTLLEPLLNNLSMEQGMDDLSLLDLRTLDPPAALGANLLMIIATARSEKHLHVSADRLCRWLRTEHRLRPFADGLLGRNELKLKQKRKAKRARLMSGIGAKATGQGEVDDGIRTGWVCVNVGEVEGGVLPKEESVSEDFVGFRTEAKGCRVVVQLLTDERRGALDLEGLWSGILNRARGETVAEDSLEGIEKAAKRKETPSPFPDAQTITFIERSP